MDFVDLKNKSEKQLQELLNEQREELRNLRFKAGDRQLKDVRKIREVKNTVARILTLLVQKSNKKIKENKPEEEVKSE